MDKLTMFLMLHGGTITFGSRSMDFYRDKELWIVKGYVNKYNQPSLYIGDDLDKALISLRTGKTQLTLEALNKYQS